MVMAFLGTNSVLSRFAIALAFVAVASSAVASSADDEFDWKKEQQFWAFQRPVAPQRPQVHHRRWPQQELDYFVVANMERKGLSPSARADKRVLIRRLAYDLTGLPPTPAD